MEYVKETLMSATDGLDGENMYTMALFLQVQIGGNYRGANTET